MIDLIFYTLAVRALTKFVFLFGSIQRITRSAKIGNRSQSLSDGRRIVILVKVFEENDRAEELVTRLKYLVSADSAISAVIVGTERERNGMENPTVDTMIKLSGDCEQISVIEAAGHFSETRPGQLNYAIDRLTSDTHRTWVLHMDADTELAESSLTQLIAEVNTDKNIILQSSLFTKNFDSVSYLQKGHALLQSRWTLSHELLRIRLSQHIPLVLTHLVGHGSCIRLEDLRIIGGWPELLETEDIELGFYFCVKGVKTTSLSVIGNSESPSTLVSGFQQEVAW